MFLPMVSPYISIIGFGEVELMSLADITADGIEGAKPAHCLMARTVSFVVIPMGSLPPLRMRHCLEAVSDLTHSEPGS